MGFDRNSASVLILCSLPFHFNVLSDAMGKIMEGIKIGWKRELSYYEDYFANKITGYVGDVFSIIFIFIYYKVGKMRLIVSVLFICNAVTWLFYLAIDENKIYILFIIKALQGIYCSGLQIAHFSYLMHFGNDSNKCFLGCLTQFSMFAGLFFENLIFALVSWKAAIFIFFAESFIFGGLIWLVPEYHIKSKSITKESIFRKENIKMVVISTISMCLQLLSGIGILLSSLSKMLGGVGLDLSGPLQSCLFDFVGGLACLISAFITDPIGSKYMFSFSCFGLFIGLLMYAFTLKISTPKWLGALSVFVYFLFYGLGMGPIPWYLFSVLVPEGCRIESTAIGTLSNLFIPTLLDLLWNALDKATGQFGSTVFGAADCLLSIIFGLVFIPVEHNNVEGNINIL